MQCVFATEPLSQKLFTEALPMLREHWREVAHFQDIELEPDYALYEAAARAGILRFFTMRVGLQTVVDGPVYWTLFGYAVFFVRPNPHYKQSLQAAQDVLFVDRRFRGLRAAKFIRFCDEQLASEGVEVVRHHLKAAHNHERLMARLGYEVEDIIYVKRLTHGSDRSDAGHLGRLDDQPESGEPGREGPGRGIEAAAGRGAEELSGRGA